MATDENKAFKRSILVWAALVALLWVIKTIELAFGLELYSFGLLPRTFSGLAGIFTFPFIHGDVAHLASNTLPLFFLGAGIFYFYPKISQRIIFTVFIVSGVLVWLFARDSYHIGASGLNYGFATFLFFSGILSKNTRMMALSLIIIFLYGGMVWGLLPIENGVSYEGHLAGAFAGAFLAVVYRKHTPKAKQYQWEEHEEEDHAPSIGDYYEVRPPQEEDKQS